MRQFVDGITWLVIGVVLFGQAAFVFFFGWMAESTPATPEPRRVLVASGIIGVGFVAVGIAAIYLGLRRLRDVKRT